MGEIAAQKKKQTEPDLRKHFAQLFGAAVTNEFEEFRGLNYFSYKKSCGTLIRGFQDNPIDPFRTFDL